MTGAAGFIGAAVVERLLQRGEQVVGLDDLNPYYDPALKQARLDRLTSSQQQWRFHRLSISDGAALQSLFASEKPRSVIHLAAQAGVRHSLTHPEIFIQTNLAGFGHLLECCRQHAIENLVYSSSSSVYGGNKKIPFKEDQAINHPVSLYAATKKANELMAHSYSHLYGLPATGLRFFTVYGPWGRPDMAPMLFAKAILTRTPIKLFNNGNMSRDFTYIDDIVEGIVRCLDRPATAAATFNFKEPDPATSWAPHRLFNIGNGTPIPLLHFIALLEDHLGQPAIKQHEPMQPGDVEITAADTSALQEWTGFRPKTSVDDGIKKFAEWYQYYHQQQKGASC